MNAPIHGRQFEQTTANLQLYAFFHLNLAFSSIEEEQRGDVITRCYWPLLELARNHGPSAWKQAASPLRRSPHAIPAGSKPLSSLSAKVALNLSARGHSQMIGPLVPAAVTQVNLEIGNDVYHRLLGIKPAIALVNEQAYAGGLVGLYLDAGYRALLMDWDNPASHHHWPAEVRDCPQRALARMGSTTVFWDEHRRVSEASGVSPMATSTTKTTFPMFGAARNGHACVVCLCERCGNLRFPSGALQDRGKIRQHKRMGKIGASIR